MTRLSTSLFCMILVTAAFTGALWTAEKKSAPVSIESQAVNSRVEQGKRITVFTRSVVITQGEVKVTTEKAISTTGKAGFTITCTERPVFTDPGNRITAESIALTPKTSIAACSGKVKLVNNPPKAKDDKEKPTRAEITITADSLSYHYAEHTMEAGGHVTVEQDKRTHTGDTCAFNVDTGVYEVKTTPKKDEKK